MSCIAGVLRFDAQAADPQEADAMLAALRPRAPHGDEVALAGSAVLAQAFLRTGSSRAESPHRLTLDGRTWITADARIDARDELAGLLRRAGRDVRADDPHAELVLHAWHAFGERMLEHLKGDFAFAIWDGDEERLFCARDHFGVRPFYFARLSNRLVFASDIAALRRCPDLPAALDDDALGDFLLFGGSANPDATIFRDVRCLAPGTWMDVRGGNVRMQRYWQLAPRERLRLASLEDYVEGFRDVFRAAVTDRVPAGPAWVQLSGGMDSTSIAAMASGVPGAQLTAWHESSASREPKDDEASYARLVADRLRLPMQVRDIGGYELFARSGDPRLATAQPVSAPLLAAHFDALADAASAGAHVVLSGYSGDAALAHDPLHFVSLMRQGQWARFAADTLEHLRATGSPRAMGLRKLLQRRRPPPWKPPMPAWIRADFVQAHDLRSRWEAWWSRYESAEGALAMLGLPWIHRMFESNEALALPVVFRYPFHDVRLVDWLLRLPSWLLQDKRILREAMRGVLPHEIVARPKKGAPGDLVRTLAAGGKFPSGSWRDWSVPGVDADAFEQAWRDYTAGSGADSTWASGLIAQPPALASWLAQQELRDG